MNHPDSASSYVASVVTLYLEMPDTPMRVSASDQWLARHLHQNGVPLETVETALLMGSLRRLIRPPTPRAWRPSAPWPISGPSSTNSPSTQRRKAISITYASSSTRQSLRLASKSIRDHFLMMINRANLIGSKSHVGGVACTEQINNPRRRCLRQGWGTLR